MTERPTVTFPPEPADESSRVRILVSEVTQTAERAANQYADGRATASKLREHLLQFRFTAWNHPDQTVPPAQDNGETCDVCERKHPCIQAPDGEGDTTVICKDCALHIRDEEIKDLRKAVAKVAEWPTVELTAHTVERLTGSYVDDTGTEVYVPLARLEAAEGECEELRGARLALREQLTAARGNRDTALKALREIAAVDESPMALVLKAARATRTAREALADLEKGNTDA